MQIEDLAIEGYECVRRCLDPGSGLEAFIAVHDTTLGPGLGGLRIWPYADSQSALNDVLRLAEGMTYKSAIARTGLGGGKAVIVGDPRVVRQSKTLRAMGRFIESLGGRYITAEDVNTRIQDLEEVQKETRYVTGLSREKGGSGNPAPYTARGVHLGIKASMAEAFGSPHPGGRHVAVQGAGAVASHVVASLLSEGARVTVCDIDTTRVEALLSRHPSLAVTAADAIYDLDCDVFSPHALGAVLNDETIPRLKCRVVAGAANNQLAEPRHGDVLRERGIVYAPDYVINAGGIINVGCELLEGGYDEKVALAKISNIERALSATFARARERGIATSQAALEIAREILDAAKR